MNRMSSTAVASALAGAQAIGAASRKAGAEDGEDAKLVVCRGVAPVGHNDCASADGAHDRAGQSVVSSSGEDDVLVAEAGCLALNGRVKPFESHNAKLKEG